MDREELVAKAKKKYEREQLIAAAKAKFESQKAPVEQVESKTPTLGETLPAAAEGLSDIATFGYAPQIKAGLSKGISAISGYSPQEVLATLDKPIGDVISGKAYEGIPQDEQNYVQLRDAAIKQSESVKSKDPIGYGLGSGLGIAATAGLGSAGAGSKAIATGKELLTAGPKALNVLKNIGKAGLVGAGTAAAYNPGDTEGVVDPLQADKRAMAAALGGGLGVAGAAVPEIAGAVAPKLMEGAKGMAARALGRGTKSMKARIGEKGLQDIGGMALETGIVGAVPKTVNQLEASVSKFRDQVGKKIGSVIDDTAAIEKQLRSEGQRVGVNKQAIAEKIRGELIDSDTAAFFPEIKDKVEKRLEDLLKKGSDNEFLETKGAYLIKQKLGKEMERRGAWKRLKMGAHTDDDVVNAVFYDVLGDAVMDSTNALAPVVPGGVQKGIKELNKEYMMLKNMQKISSDEVARSGTNNLFDLTSNIYGAAAGGASGNPLVAAATAATVNQARKMGPQVMAKGLEQASKLAGAAAQGPSLGPVAAGLAGGAINKDLVQIAVSRKFPPQVTKGAKLLDIQNYKTSDDMESVDPMMAEQIKAQLPDADLTNTEKATIAEALQKGKVSRRVLEFLQGPAMGPNNNMDAQSVLGR